MIQLNNITKIFTVDKKRFTALNNVSLSVEQGDILGIVGESGAGKSTLVRCINLLEKPDSGNVIINGEDLTKMNNANLQRKRQEIGMIFQHFNLFSQRTIYRNIAYPLEFKGISKEKIHERVFELLEIVGLTEKANAYPSQLSGGQKQRVAIARALAANPSLLLCDEATSALDPETTKSILRLLKEINKKFGLTIIIITHEKEVVKEICNKVAILEHGNISEKGNLLDVFTNPQTEAGKIFVGNILEDEHVKQALSDSLLNENKDYRIFKLTFIGKNTAEPYISSLSKKYDLTASILFGNIDIIQGEALGNLVVKLKGETDNIELALKYLLENKVIVEEVLR